MGKIFILHLTFYLFKILRSNRKKCFLKALFLYLFKYVIIIKWYRKLFIAIIKETPFTVLICNLSQISINKKYWKFMVKCNFNNTHLEAMYKGFQTLFFNFTRYPWFAVSRDFGERTAYIKFGAFFHSNKRWYNKSITLICLSFR